MSCCCTLAAKIQSTFYECKSVLIYGIQPGVFHFLSNQAKSQFAIFPVLLFLRSTCCFQFLCTEYGTVWGITQCSSICILFVCTIIKFIKLNKFKYPTKIRLCSQADQNHLLWDIVSFSACRDKWKQLAGISFVILVSGEIWMFHLQRRVDDEDNSSFLVFQSHHLKC